MYLKALSSTIGSLSNTRHQGSSTAEKGFEVKKKNLEKADILKRQLKLRELRLQIKKHVLRCAVRSDKHWFKKKKKKTMCIVLLSTGC